MSHQDIYMTPVILIQYWEHFLAVVYFSTLKLLNIRSLEEVFELVREFDTLEWWNNSSRTFRAGNETLLPMSTSLNVIS